MYNIYVYLGKFGINFYVYLGWVSHFFKYFQDTSIFQHTFIKKISTKN